MIKKTIKFEDYNGNPQSLDFWFHINKAEAADFRFSEDGSDIVETLSRIMNDEDLNVRVILEMFKEIVRLAVGQKSEDGLRFIKNDDIRATLFETEAYSELFSEMIEDADFAGKFIAGMLPKDMAAKMEKTTDELDVKNMTKEQLAAKMLELQKLQAKTTN